MPLNRICSKCYKAFEAKTRYAFLCEACRLATKQESVVRQRTCTVCGKNFEGGPKAIYCPDCRALARREAKARFQKKGPQRKLGSTDQCKKCGKEYVVESGLQKYCKECAEEATAEAAAPKKRANAAARYKQKKKREREVRQNGTPCPCCGKGFTAGPGKFICNDCAGDYVPLNQWAEDRGIPYGTAYDRSISGKVQTVRLGGGLYVPRDKRRACAGCRKIFFPLNETDYFCEVCKNFPTKAVKEKYGVSAMCMRCDAEFTHFVRTPILCPACRDLFFTSPEYAEHVGIARRTVDDRIKKGLLRAVRYGKFWMIPKDSVDENHDKK